MPEIKLGITLVEIVTSGLYKNSLDVIREYIQNSCDAIDDAIDAGILEEDEEEITIDIDPKARRITIEDNGIGIPTRYFKQTMSNIGHSDKTLETSRGFRGIGRLGGLAYCNTLIFSTKVAGERKFSTLTIDAEKLRKEFFSDNKRSAEVVLMANLDFNTIDATPETPEHFFRVEMIGIVDTNTDLLNVAKVYDYLSFVAPVPYHPQFEFRNQIHKYAASLGFKITEYYIFVNGKLLWKNYTTDIQTTYNGYDKIFDVEFREVHDADEKLIAWFWFGVSEFKGVLSEAHDTDSYKMRGIRLRQKNIQIGDALILRSVFDEDQRGTKYFIGEVHTIDTNLRPNSERDDFEENAAYNNLKSALEKCFVELNNLYSTAVKVRNLINAIDKPKKAVSDFQRGRSKFKNRDELKAELNELNKFAIRADNELYWLHYCAERHSDMVLIKFINHVMKNRRPFEPPPLPDEIKNFPPSNWSKKSRDIYETIKDVILANPTVGGKKLLDKIIERLSK